MNTDLAAGIPLPGIVARTIRVEPEAIADAVVRSLDGRPAEIAVPRWLGLYPVVQPFVPPIVESAVRRLVGDDRALSADAARRAAYDARIARQAAR